MIGLALWIVARLRAGVTNPGGTPPGPNFGDAANSGYVVLILDDL
jgi:hypothetical protein